MFQLFLEHNDVAHQCLVMCTSYWEICPPVLHRMELTWASCSHTQYTHTFTSVSKRGES